MLTTDYYQIISDEKLDLKYRSCLSDLITRASNVINDLETVALIGGLARSTRIINDWSDIDALVVCKHVDFNACLQIDNFIKELETEYAIRLDVIKTGLNDLTAGVCTDAIIVSVLSRPKSLAKVLYGKLPELSFTKEHEKQVSLYHMNHIFYEFRFSMGSRLLECHDERQLKRCLERVIRWAFSLVRSSLVLFDIFSHPYEESIDNLKHVFPEADITTLRKLGRIREQFSEYELQGDLSIFQEAGTFIENYYHMVMETYQ